MTSSPQIKKTFAWTGKNPADLVNAEVLLNLLPGPAIIIDKTKEIILLANATFIRLVGYSEEEIYTHPLDQFVLGFQTDLLQTGENFSGVIKRRNRTSLSVSFRIQAVDQEEAKLVVVFKNPESDLEVKSVNPVHEQMLENLLELISCSDSEELDISIKTALEVFSTMVGTNLMCLYQANSDSPGLRKVITCEPITIFPDEIPSTDLIRLSGASMWIPGAPVQTEIHRAGRVADLKYVASIPLGQSGALSGLLVLGGAGRMPPANLGSLLQFLSSLISTKTQHFILDENSRDRIYELENQNNVLTELFNVAQEGIIILSSNLAIARMNSAAEFMLGYAETEVQGQLVENILIGPDGLIRALEKANEGIPFHNLGTVHIHRRSGQSFPANLQVIPVMKDGELFAVLIFISDVSQNEQIKARTQQLEHRAVLGEFTAVFAHEVRNPINNISTGLQLLSTLLKTDDPNQDIINRMLGDCNRLNQLMESVLSFSRPLETKFEPVDLSLLLQRILDRWRPRLAKVNVELFFQPVSNLPKILGDIRSLEQVFTNLVSNAVEAMSKNGGMLAIRINKYDQIPNTPQIEVGITDSGPGIPDEIKGRLFEPFVSNNPRGTGLGLAITKRIVTAHRGSISVDTFPGGTVFRVYLPTVNGEVNEHNNTDR